MKIKLTFLFLFALLSIGALAQNKADAQLTKAEQKAGWRLLFDGKTLNGWRGFHSQTAPGGWVVEGGCITKTKAKGELGQAGGDLITVDQFQNFEFSIEWRLGKGGNSGIKYLVSESLPPTGKSAVSFEYQVLEENAANIGAKGVLEKIVNLAECEDGLYEVVTCNPSTDWETGYIDDYDYELVPFSSPNCAGRCL